MEHIVTNLSELPDIEEASRIIFNELKTSCSQLTQDFETAESFADSLEDIANILSSYTAEVTLNGPGSSRRSYIFETSFNSRVIPLLNRCPQCLGDDDFI